ncbi:hypothetical protein GCM10022268_00600 [Sphingomonas cynarae]|uniref:Uncharacterized protein n=1 Tax=Sphingomonas cynarae TaxID=930197 RepID=A0ABP7CSI4_9SPHN
MLSGKLVAKGGETGGMDGHGSIRGWKVTVESHESRILQGCAGWAHEAWPAGAGYMTGADATIMAAGSGRWLRCRTGGGAHTSHFR